MMRELFAAVVFLSLVWSFFPAGVTIPKPTPPPAGPVAVSLVNANKPDRQRVSAYYAVLADTIQRDPGIIKTVGQFRELHGRSLDLAFKGTDLPGKYPGLDLAMDQTLAAVVGMEDVPLQPAKVQSLIQALKDVSNAAQ